MELSINSLFLFTVFSAVIQVAEANSALALGGGIAAGLIVVALLSFGLRHILDKKCNPQEVSPADEPKKVKVRKVKMETTHQQPQWQVGQQPFPGAMSNQPQHHPPPMQSDPAYPPTMPASHTVHSSNPFSNAASNAAAYG